jgi:hypothetical protein
VEGTGGRLQVATNRLNKILKDGSGTLKIDGVPILMTNSADNKTTIAIIVLSIIAVILFVFALT